MTHKKTKKPETKMLANLFSHSDKIIEKLQNIEIRLAIFDIEKVIQDFCMNKEVAPSIKKINEILNDDNMQFSNPPSTDHKDVVQLSLKDIVIKEFKLAYDKEEFECKGDINVDIPKLKLNIKVKIPQGLTTSVRLKMIDFGRSN